MGIQLERSTMYKRYSKCRKTNILQCQYKKPKLARTALLNRERSCLSDLPNRRSPRKDRTRQVAGNSVSKERKNQGEHATHYGARLRRRVHPVGIKFGLYHRCHCWSRHKGSYLVVLEISHPLVAEVVAVHVSGKENLRK